MEDMASETQRTGVSELLVKHGFEPSAAMEQYFLARESKIDAMLSAARISPTDHVIELGAGIGSVAKRMGKVSHLNLVELDEWLCDILRNEFADMADVTIHRDDAIAWMAGHDADVIISNLPCFLVPDLLDVLAEKEFRTAVISMSPDQRLDRWDETFEFSYVETNEGDDFEPPQPVASEVFLVTRHRPITNA